MAVVIPTTVQLNYKKYSTTIDIRTLRVNAAGDGLPAMSYLTFQDQPSWLSITNVSPITTNDFNFDLQVRKTTANQIAGGTYTQVISIYGIINQNGPGQPVFLASFSVTLNLEETVVLTLNPTDAVFDYLLADPLPKTRTLVITSENNWQVTKDKSWITISKTTGTGNSTLQFGVNPTGLNVGTYTGTVTVNDGLFTKVLNIVLQVNGVQTPVNYLKVLPTAVQIVEGFGEDPQDTKTISVDATDNWQASANVAWLDLSVFNGVAGVTSMTLTADIDGLAIGSYTGIVTYVMGNIQKLLSVVLSVRKSTINGLASENFYFADDINTLTVNNTLNNTFAVLDVVAEHEQGTEVYTKEAPFLKGLANLEIGQETRNLLNPDAIPDSLITNVTIPFYPVTYGFKLLEKDRNTNGLTPKNSFSGVKFINGRTPSIANRLSYMPSLIYTVKDAVIAFNFIAPDGLEEYVVTGAVDETIQLNLNGKEDSLYRMIWNLSDYNLSPGDSLNMSIAGFSLTVRILDSEPEHTLLAFENEWQLPEMMMCRGFLTIDGRRDHETTDVYNNRKVETKVIDTRNVREYEVRTGFIRTQAERAWLMNIFESRNIYLYVDGQKVPVILRSSSLEEYETRSNFISYRLLFKKAII